MTHTPLTFDELFGPIPFIQCKRFGHSIEIFITENAEHYLELISLRQTYKQFLTVMCDKQITLQERNWIWLRRAKGFERTMDRIIMQVAVTNFKCKHGRMPTLEELLGDNDGFEDSYNHQEACADYEEPAWPQDWPTSIRRKAYQTFTDYMTGIYEQACAEHRRARSIAYSAA